jgi:hypothetical protein
VGESSVSTVASAAAHVIEIRRILVLHDRAVVGRAPGLAGV